MKTIFISLTLLLLTLISNCQDINILNGYKYIIVSPLVYANGSNDIHGVRNLVFSEISKKRFIVLNNWDEAIELQNNPCMGLVCFINHTNNSSPTLLWGKNSVTLEFKNCNNELVYSSEGECGAADYKISSELKDGAKKALKELIKMNYHFNNKLTPRAILPEVEQINLTEESLKEYFTSNKLDAIEGIYKSYQSDGLTYYKFGIIKRDNKFKAVIIETDNNIWKPKEVKAVFEQTSMKGFYSVKWFLGNKSSIETFGNMENEALLSIEFKNLKTGEKKQDKFVKMFPSGSPDITFKKNETKASGS